MPLLSTVVATSNGSGNVYVTGKGVRKFDRTGTLLAIWDGGGSAAGQFSEPDGIAVDARGNVFADTGNNRIQELDGSGHFLTAWGILRTKPAENSGRPVEVAVGSGSVYVADYDRTWKFACQ